MDPAAWRRMNDEGFNLGEMDDQRREGYKQIAKQVMETIKKPLGTYEETMFTFNDIVQQLQFTFTALALTLKEDPSLEGYLQLTLKMLAQVTGDLSTIVPENIKK